MKFLFISLAVFLAGCHTIKAAQSPVRQDRQNPPAVKEQPQTEASARPPASSGEFICVDLFLPGDSATNAVLSGWANTNCDSNKNFSISFRNNRRANDGLVCCIAK